MKNNCVKSRTVLWWLTFVGFAINYMIRINLNITIVDMVVQKKFHGNNLSTNFVEGTCLNGNTAESITANFVNESVLSTDRGWKTYSLERKLLQKLNVSPECEDMNGNIEYRLSIVAESTHRWLWVERETARHVARIILLDALGYANSWWHSGSKIRN